MIAARKLESLNEKFLTCPICTEGYKDPSTLACGHTFCKVCLGKFLKTRQDAISAKSIPCPHCRQTTLVPHPDRSVEEWVRQIKPSFLIQGLLDTLGSVDVSLHCTEHPCQPCLDVGEETPATSFCQQCDVQLCDRCVKMHASLPATSNHVIADLDGAAKATRRHRPRCKEHNEVMDLCCRGCNTMICPRCGILHHRKCDSVVTLQSMMSEMRNVLNNSMDLITQRLDDTSRLVLQHRSQIEELSRNRDTAESQIKLVSQKAISVIKQKEKQLLDELDEMTEKQSGQLKGEMKSGEIDMQMYQQHTEYLNQVLKSGSETDMFEMYRMCESGALKESIDRSGFSDSLRYSNLVFICGVNEGKLDNIVHLGRIHQNPCEPVMDVRLDRMQQSLPEPVMDEVLDRIQSSTFDAQCGPVFHQTVDIRVDGDLKKPDPADLTVLVVGGVETLVVTDLSNSCLKSFSTDNGKSRSCKLNLKGQPRTVTRLGGNRVLVSFSSHNEMVVVRVSPDLLLLARISTKKRYRCATALNPSTLAAGCGDPPCVDILDMSGTVLRSVSRLNRGKTERPCPWSLCCTPDGNILVSDFGSHSVHCITPEGDVVFTSTGAGSLGEPRGIATTSTGHILVADWGERKVILLTATGEFVRVLLAAQTGVFHPYGLFLCGPKLYVMEYKNDVVKVFTCVSETHT